MFDIANLFNKHTKTNIETKPEITTIVCMSVLIRNFEAITGNIPLSNLAKLMQLYYGTIASTALKYNADIDRFCHNYVLIYFKHDIQQAEDAALKCGQNIINRLHDYDNSLDIGVGICKGEIIYGVFGSESRATVTGFGPAVNCAIELSRNKSGISSVNIETP